MSKFSTPFFFTLSFIFGILTFAAPFVFCPIGAGLIGAWCRVDEKHKSSLISSLLGLSLATIIVLVMTFGRSDATPFIKSLLIGGYLTSYAFMIGMYWFSRPRENANPTPDAL